MDSELAHGHVSKLLLKVAIDLGLNLIVKTSILFRVKSSPSFYLETVRFIGFPRSSYRGVIYFVKL